MTPEEKQQFEELKLQVEHTKAVFKANLAKNARDYFMNTYAHRKLVADKIGELYEYVKILYESTIEKQDKVEK